MTRDNFQIIRCTACGTRNRISADKIGAAAKCGKCGAALPPIEKKAEQAPTYVIRCLECGTRNRIPSGKIGDGARCGKCKAAIQTKGLFEGRPLTVTDADFDTEVLKSPLPVLFFCWAPWCPSCRMIIPDIDELAKAWKGRVRVGKLNMDGNPMVPSKFNIMSVPTLLIFDNGQLKDRMVGAMPKHQIMQKMAPYL